MANSITDVFYRVVGYMYNGEDIELHTFGNELDVAQMYAVGVVNTHSEYASVEVHIMRYADNGTLSYMGCVFSA